MVKKIKKQLNDSDNEYEIDENEDNFIDDEFDDDLDIDEDKINDTDDIIDHDTEINYNKYNINEDYEYSDYDDYENEPSKSNINLLSKDKRISSNRLTKYEMVRILGERTKQLTMGAKPIVKNYENLSYEKIAEEEFKLNMIPFKIKRYLPNNKYELWTLDELQKEHLLFQLE
jgi:DNA-directed RNA polymerase I, II, and III subunit RPABC2